MQCVIGVQEVTLWTQLCMQIQSQRVVANLDYPGIGLHPTHDLIAQEQLLKGTRKMNPPERHRQAMISQWRNRVTPPCLSVYFSPRSRANTNTSGVYRSHEIPDVVAHRQIPQ